MRVMVTGGAGFIGSAVCRHFVLDLGHQVVVVDKLTYAGNLASLKPVSSSPHFAFEKLDICDADGIKAIFSKYQPAAVVHLAAESHVDRSISDAVEQMHLAVHRSKKPQRVLIPRKNRRRIKGRCCGLFAHAGGQHTAEKISRGSEGSVQTEPVGSNGPGVAVVARHRQRRTRCAAAKNSR